jgi:hypothetical protein
MKMNHRSLSKYQKITLAFFIFSLLFGAQAWSADRLVLGEVFSRTS